LEALVTWIIRPPKPALVARGCSAAQASCLHCIRATPAYLHQGLPICVTTGRTIEETRRLIAEAVEAQAA
jgi:hypothetical protein